MNRIEFAEGFAKFADLPKYKSKALCDMFFDYLAETFSNMEVGDKISIYGFGTFERRRIKGHLVGNILAGEGTQMMPESSKIVFRQSKIAM